MNRVDLKLMTFMAVAGQISLLGTCDRKKVGAVIVKRGRCISWGFNGAPEGLPHCDENNHGWDDVIRERYLSEGRRSWHITEFEADSNYAAQSGCRNATHAEANALAFAARQGISTGSATLFVTVSPCETCARLLLAAGIKSVYYLEEYRDRRGIELIEGAGGTALSLQRDHGDRDPSG